MVKVQAERRALLQLQAQLQQDSQQLAKDRAAFQAQQVLALWRMGCTLHGDSQNCGLPYQRSQLCPCGMCAWVSMCSCMLCLCAWGDLRRDYA